MSTQEILLYVSLMFSILYLRLSTFKFDKSDAVAITQGSFDYRRSSVIVFKSVLYFVLLLISIRWLRESSDANRLVGKVNLTPETRCLILWLAALFGLMIVLSVLCRLEKLKEARMAHLGFKTKLVFAIETAVGLIALSVTLYELFFARYK